MQPIYSFQRILQRATAIANLVTVGLPFDIE
jgi:hypothetical protein